MSLFSPNQEPQGNAQPAGDVTGSLESLGIPVQTSIPDGILTPATAKSIHFRTKGRTGYSFKEVDQFVVNIVRPAIDWYVNALYQRDVHVHKLGEALDKAGTDIRNLRAQAQFLDYNSQIAKGLEMGQDDAEVKALMDRLTATEAELQAAQAELRAARSDDVVQELLGERPSEPTTISPDYNLPLVYPDAVAADSQLAQSGGATVNDTQLLAKLEEQETLAAQLQEKLNSVETLYQQALVDLEASRQEAFEAVLAVEEAAKKADGNAGIPTATVDEVAVEAGVDPAAQAYIDRLQMQYDELKEMYEVLSERYVQEVRELQEQISADKASLAQLQEAAQQAPVVADNTTTGTGEEQLDEATQAYIDELLGRYNELSEQYTRDTTALQSQVDELVAGKQQLEAQYAELLATASETGAEGTARTEPNTLTEELQAEVLQLREYYEIAVNQHNTLLDMYNQMAQQVEAGGGNITIVQANPETAPEEVGSVAELAPTEVDLSQYVSIEDYQAVVAENEQLRQQLTEAFAETTEDEEEYTPQFMLPAEDLKRTVDPSKYTNLPPGVLPEDLE